MNINLFDYDSVNVQVLFTPNGNYRFINATVALFDMVECIGSFFTTYTYDCLAVCPSSSMYLNNGNCVCKNAKFNYNSEYKNCTCLSNYTFINDLQDCL